MMSERSRQSRIVVAAVQATPVLLDREATLEKTLLLVEEAAGRGAEVVAFPETWLPGYPVWAYGAAGWEDERAKRVHARLIDQSVAVPSPTTDALCEAAATYQIELVVGINERDIEWSQGTLYNSQLFIGSDGRIRGVHRKLVPTHAERLVWGQGDGSTLDVFTTPLGRVGGLVCWEHWMPLARFAMHAQGEQLHVAAWPEATSVEHLASRHYAFEGRCFVLCCGATMRTSDIPADFELRDAIPALGSQSDDPDELLRGGSGVIGPNGEWIAGPVYGKEEIVVAEVDLRRIAEEQQTFDAVGHYNRPDVFQLTVDRRSRSHVQWVTDLSPQPAPTSMSATQI